MSLNCIQYCNNLPCLKLVDCDWQFVTCQSVWLRTQWRWNIVLDLCHCPWWSVHTSEAKQSCVLWNVARFLQSALPTTSDKHRNQFPVRPELLSHQPQAFSSKTPDPVHSGYCCTTATFCLSVIFPEKVKITSDFMSSLVCITHLELAYIHFNFISIGPIHISERFSHRAEPWLSGHLPPPLINIYLYLIGWSYQTPCDI